jgi:hypothetical protein
MASKNQTGRINPAVADKVTEEDIERQSLEDGEDEFFDRNATPDRVETPYPQKRPVPVR